jgi:hypothetical protein
LLANYHTNPHIRIRCDTWKKINLQVYILFLTFFSLKIGFRLQVHTCPLTEFSRYNTYWYCSMKKNFSTKKLCCRLHTCRTFQVYQHGVQFPSPAAASRRLDFHLDPAGTGAGDRGGPGGSPRHQSRSGRIVQEPRGGMRSQRAHTSRPDGGRRQHPPAHQPTRRHHVVVGASHSAAKGWRRPGAETMARRHLRVVGPATTKAACRKPWPPKY